MSEIQPSLSKVNPKKAYDNSLALRADEKFK
jgi:hypothetical protein